VGLGVGLGVCVGGFEWVLVCVLREGGGRGYTKEETGRLPLTLPWATSHPPRTARRWPQEGAPRRPTRQTRPPTLLLLLHHHHHHRRLCSRSCSWFGSAFRSLLSHCRFHPLRCSWVWNWLRQSWWRSRWRPRCGWQQAQRQTSRRSPATPLQATRPRRGSSSRRLRSTADTMAPLQAPMASARTAARVPTARTTTARGSVVACTEAPLEG
jgi:hypothetical protein